MKSLHYCSLLTCFFLFLVGCTANRPYRTSLPVPPDTNRPTGFGYAPIDPIKNSVIETNAGFDIGYVEFDDEGWFWAYRQWQAVKTEIEAEGAEDTNGLTIIVFVHGWKNNAAFDDGNVQTFRAALTNLSATLKPRKVFGIFVGWRGLSTESDYFPPGGKELSIYNRKNAAERIGHQGSATQVFTELEQLQDELNDTNIRPNFQRTELVIIGHSFGGQLVYSAISQILIERLVQATSPDWKRQVRSIGDLVVLLNPAFEASQYNNLVSLATSSEIHYPPNQPPVLAILTSKTDGATGFWFHLGMWFSTLNEPTRPSPGPKEVWLFNVKKSQPKNEEDAILESVGHDDDYIDYDLNYTNYSQSGFRLSTEGHGLSALVPVGSPRNALLTNNVTENVTNLVPYVFVHSNGTNQYAFVLQHRKNGFKAADPILDVAVDPHIMDGHGDIANTNLIQFLRDFILFNHTNYLYKTETSSTSR